MHDLERRVLDSAAATGVPFESIPCDPALADTADFCARYGYRLDQSANAIVVASRKPPGLFACCLLLATTRLEVNRSVRRHLGARKVSFASPEQTRELTGMEIGGVTPFGLPPTLPLWIDSAVMGLDHVIVGGGSRGLKLWVPPAALAALPGARVIEDLARPHPAPDPPADPSAPG